ncbi:MAG: hypothetical protein P4L76_18090 [Beijerinckiaceae bacterium]|nr:hypothetical protein [Beijerinckiaceae bacterium]
MVTWWALLAAALIVIGILLLFVTFADGMSDNPQDNEAANSPFVGAVICILLGILIAGWRCGVLFHWW